MAIQSTAVAQCNAAPVSSHPRLDPLQLYSQASNAVERGRRAMHGQQGDFEAAAQHLTVAIDALRALAIMSIGRPEVTQ